MVQRSAICYGPSPAAANREGFDDRIADPALLPAGLATLLTSRGRILRPDLLPSHF